MHGIRTDPLIVAAFANNPEAPILPLERYETVCTACHLVYNLHLDCTNCSSRG